MFGGRKKPVEDIEYMRTAGRLLGPAKSAVVDAGLIHRWRSSFDIALWLRSANVLKETIGLEIFLSVLALIAGGIVLVVTQQVFGAQIVISWGDPGVLSAGVAGIALFAASILGPGRILPLLFLVTLSVLFPILGVTPSQPVFVVFSVIVGTAVIARNLFDIILNMVRGNYAHKGDKRENSDTLSLNFKQAEKVAIQAQSILEECFGAKRIEAISSIRTDRAAPYRWIRGLLPVGPLFYRRPRKEQRPPLTVQDPRYRDYRFVIDMSDALCAGLLGLAGVRPRLRYAEDTDRPLAQDRYWRNDVQELHDTGVGDVFLRFHQSTVEADFPPTATSIDVCTFKTYAVMNNFRRTPLFLLKVSDVIGVLKCEHPAFSKAQQAKNYADLIITPEEAMEYLQDGKFAKQTARADRFKVDSTSDPLGKPILAFGDNDDDPIMSFDAARVWPRTDARRGYFHAVMALRGAIHIVSRKLAIEVSPSRRDVLLVDNMRMLICRREDGPTGVFTPISLCRDILAASAPILAGRWIRQIYGFTLRVSQSEAQEDRQAQSLDVSLEGRADEVLDE
jgi:hypothetical protein